MKVTRKVIPVNADPRIDSFQKAQDTRWFLEEVAQQLVRSWYDQNSEKIKEILGNQEQAPYNASMYEASLFILTPREAYIAALLSVNTKKADLEYKTDEQLREMACTYAPRIIAILEAPPKYLRPKR